MMKIAFWLLIGENMRPVGSCAIGGRRFKVIERGTCRASKTDGIEPLKERLLSTASALRRVEKRLPISRGKLAYTGQ